MTSETETPTARVPSRETMETRAFGKVVRARKELAEARASLKRADERHKTRCGEKRKALEEAEKALAAFSPEVDPPQD